MIEVKAERIDSETTRLEITIEGNAYELGIEAARIVTGLPEHLLKNADPAFYVMRSAVKTISENLQEEYKELKIMEEDNDGHEH